MTRLPVPGSDDNTWGDILNDFLTVEHNSDGSLKLRTDGTLTAKESTANKGAANGYAGLNGSAQVPSGQLGSGTANSTSFLRGDGTWAAPPASGIPASTVTTKGDLIAATGSATVSRFGVGANGQALVADSTQATGLNWATLATDASVLKKANNLSDLASASTARTNLGLGNVDNTSDVNKPVSTATQTAIDQVDANALVYAIVFG